MHAFRFATTLTAALSFMACGDQPTETQSTAAAAASLIPNGGFESAVVAPWIAWGSFYVASAGRSGLYAAVASPNAGGGVTVDVTEGQQYSLTLHAQRFGGGRAYVAYKFLDSAWRQVGSTWESADVPSDWTAFNESVVVPAGASRLMVFCWNAATGDLRIDDVSLEVYSPPPPPPPPPAVAANLVGNSGFESGALAPWNAWGSMQVESSRPHAGSYHATVSSNAGGGVVVDVQPGETYSYSIWAASASTGGRAYVGYQFLNAQWQGVQAPWESDNISTDYRQFQTEFTVPAAATRVQLFVWNSANGSVVVDDVALSEVTGGPVIEPPPPPPPPSTSFNPGSPPAAVSRWFVRDTETPIAVPSDFFGLHVDRSTGWPNFETLPAPNFDYGLVRSHDHNAVTIEVDLMWLRLEVAPGVYDFSAVNNWINETPGKTRIFTVFGTPSFYQKYPGESWRYPTFRGGGSPPRDPSALMRFVQALLARFPNQIDYIEVWNEPNMMWTGSDTNSTRWDAAAAAQFGAPFFSGTAEDLAAMTRAAAIAVAGTSARLMSGAWEGQTSNSNINSFGRFSRAPDGAGGVGRDHVEVFTFHHYIYAANPDPNLLQSSIDDYRGLLSAYGYPSDIEIHCSEIGHEGSVPLAISTAQVAHNIKRATYIAAANRVQSIAWYKWSRYTLGDPHRNADVAAALGEAAAVAGQTIRQAALLQDGRVWLRFENNSELVH